MGLIGSKQKRQSVIHRTFNDTHFEDLSNELIYDLFDYLPYHDICFAFGHLNARFDDLIETCSPSVDLQRYSENSRYSLPNHFRSLRISSRHQIALIDFSQVSVIRALLLANIPAPLSLDILNTIPLERLEYVYVGASPEYHTIKEGQMAFLQETILRLAQTTLKRCVFRTRFYGNVDVLPYGLGALEYLRIDGCQNVLIANRLLDRMPNLKYFHVSILDSLRPEKERSDQKNEIEVNRLLTHLIIRANGLASPEDLLPIFTRHGANVHTLTIHLNYIFKAALPSENPVDVAFAHRHKWTTAIIDPYFRHLKQFQIRQRVFSDSDDFQNRPLYFAPYREEISCSSSARSYRVTISSQLTELWRQSLWMSDRCNKSTTPISPWPSTIRRKQMLECLFSWLNKRRKSWLRQLMYQLGISNKVQFATLKGPSRWWRRL